ncbi:SGNH/GDSL hydrolase family protein [Amycolatopsis sp. NPDC059021]|uniref:SGNH/GDSL hydrolase family protein n=1 Tax=Amycolatopsis sp. NPDC059021 TaxID=3346704 RepID=UPI0036700736
MTRPLIRWCTAVAVAALTTFGLAGTANAIQATTYAALGDSYSSGVGAGDYGDSGDCMRSSNAYPQLWTNAHSGTKLTFVACSGARTGDVVNQAASVTSGTTLVTVSVGGNDAGFTDVIKTCTLNDDQTCVNRVNQAKTYVNGTLPGLLDKVYSTIKQKAPNAKLVVLGYPHMYKVPGSCNVGLSDTKRSAINSGSDALASTISQRASAAGATFIDMRSPFSGHEICSSDWWLHSLTWPVTESYHPTATGQSSGYYAALKAKIG